MTALSLSSRAGTARLDVLGLLRKRAEILILGVLYLSLYALPKHNYLGVQVAGAVNGSLLALQTIGVVLVLRATKIINFAQVALGAVSGVMFYELVHRVELAQIVVQVCPSCLSGVSTDSTYNQSHPRAFLLALLANHHRGWVVANFWLSLVIALAIGPVLGFAAYVGIMRRFAQAPRLIATVATIAMTSVFGYLASKAGGLFPTVRESNAALYIPLPQVDVSLKPNQLHLADFLVLGAVPLLLLGLALLLRFTTLGAAMAAVAENARRAVTLGISANVVAAMSWSLAATLSAVAAILATIGGGTSGASSGLFDVPMLVQILTAVVFARMTGLVMVTAAALVLGIAAEAFLWNFHSSVPFQGMLLLPLLALVLLVQQGKESRAEQEATASYLGAREARPVPVELRGVEAVGSVSRFGAMLVAAVVLGYPFFMSPDQVSLGSNVLILSIVGLSVLVLTGWAGQVSLGQLGFAAVGGYAATYLGGQLHLFMPLTLILAGVAGAAVSLLVGIPALRLRGFHLAAVTLAFSLSVTLLVTSRDYAASVLPDSMPRPVVLGISLKSERSFYYVSLFFLVATVAAVTGLRRSRIARVLIACRDNEQAGQSFGVSLFKARLTAFVLAGFMAAVAGGLISYHEFGLQPQSFAPEQSLNLFLLVILGGLGSVVGPLLGMLYFGAFSMLHNPLLTLLLTGLGVLFVMLVLPGGLSAVAFSVRDAFLRRVAIRNRIEALSLLGEKGVQALRGRAAIEPGKGPGGRAVFIADRYSLPGQFADEGGRST